MEQLSKLAKEFKNVEYCSSCTFPFEYCEFSEKPEDCLNAKNNDGNEDESKIQKLISNKEIIVKMVRRKYEKEIVVLCNILEIPGSVNL